MTYNKLILSQDNTVSFRVSEEAATDNLPNGEARKVWDKLSRKFQPTTGASKTRNLRKFTMRELKDVTRYPED